MKTDFLASSGSKILKPEAVYAGTPYLIPEDVVGAVLFALGCPSRVQVSPRLRSSMQLVRLLATAFNYDHICMCQCLSEGTARNVHTISIINPYTTAFPYGNGMVLHFYQQQESSTTKTVHKVINKGLKSLCIVASHW